MSITILGFVKKTKSCDSDYVYNYTVIFKLFSIDGYNKTVDKYF